MIFITVSIRTLSFIRYSRIASRNKKFDRRIHELRPGLFKWLHVRWTCFKAYNNFSLSVNSNEKWRFYLGQSWWRKIQTVGLSQEYKKKFKYQYYSIIVLKYFFGLQFLKPDEVEDCFTDDIVSILPEDEKVQQFFNYILNTYIKPDCDFLPSVWAMYSCSIIRTTNSCKAFHSKFKSMFYSTHPNIF
jgi:hypothetical protein